MSDSGIDLSAPPSGTGCLECDDSGSWWVHLRRCAECGHVGCCDSSLNRHGTAHFASTGHPIMQSFEPGEDWFYDFRSGQILDAAALGGAVLAAPTSHPLDQSTPGPAERVPANWQALLGG